MTHEMTHVDTGGVGNTSTPPQANIRARSWVFTLNNYTKEEVTHLTHSFKDSKRYVFQEEKGEEGTKHLQGFVEYANARSFTSMKKLCPRWHLEKCRDIKGSIAYCMKEESRDGEIYHKGIKLPMKPKISEEKLKVWQKFILKILSDKPDDRKIIWVVDTKGGAGKTTFARDLIIKNPDTYLYVAGKAADIKYGIAKFIEEHTLNTVILDFSRDLENYVSYSGIEQIKNGIFYSTKYESGQVIFDIPHILVFSNFFPDTEKLSGDRWLIISTEMFNLSQIE